MREISRDTGRCYVLFEDIHGHGERGLVTVRERSVGQRGDKNQAILEEIRLSVFRELMTSQAVVHSPPHRFDRSTAISLQ